MAEKSPKTPQRVGIVGSELTDMRVMLKLTQQQMADHMGVSLRQYHRYEASLEPLKPKVENMARAVVGRSAAVEPRGDKRFKKPVDYVALGKPLTVYLTAGPRGEQDAREFNPSLFGLKGDPALRPRVKTLEEALQHETVAHWRVVRSEERDDGFYIWLDA